MRFRKYVQILEAKIAIITIGLFPYSINSSTPPPYYHAAFIPCTPNDFPKAPKQTNVNDIKAYCEVEQFEYLT